MKTFSTGEIAKFCDVNLRTVIRWIEKGELDGFKLPGRGNNRVTEQGFLDFLQKHNMPIPEDLKGSLPDKKGILIVDDEASIAKAIHRVLKGAGYQTTLAFDGFSAGSKLMQEKPELVTLDLSMPGLDGYDVIKFIRKTSEINDTKILVISALDQSKLEEAINCGADSYLQKPFANSELLRIVEQLTPAPQSLTGND